PLDGGSHGIAKIVRVSATPPFVVEFGVYPVRLARGASPPPSIDAGFAELLHGLPSFGAKGWTILRNDPPLAREILPTVKTATTQPNRPRKKLPQRDLELLASGLRVATNVDGTATVTFTPAVARQLELSTPLVGWLERRVEEIVAYAESSRTAST